MKNEIKKGNIEEVKKASEENVELVLLRKDFSTQKFVRINLNKAAISKCIFNQTSFFANQYKSCDFISCDFTKADFLNVKFIDCKFHECKFDEAELQEVNFQNCSIMTCSFTNIKIKSNVIGIDEKDFNVIHEEVSFNENELTKLGFSKVADKNEMNIYSKTDNGPAVFVSIAKDEEMGDDVYRIMLFVDNEVITSDTFDAKDDDLETISRITQSILNSGNKRIDKFFAENKDQAEKAKAELKNIKSKFNRYFSEDQQ